MEHHRVFNVYSKHTRSEIIFDLLFFKNKYFTSPILTPEDTVIEAAKRLIDTVTSNSNSTKYEQMESLKRLGKVFKKIADKNVQEVVDKQPKNNSIKTYNKEPQPKVAVPQTRVESTKPEQEIYPQLIVKC